MAGSACSARADLLWRDWCEATGSGRDITLSTAPDPVLAQFLTDVQLAERDLRAIRAARRRRLPQGGPLHRAPRQQVPDDVLDRALRTCATSTWPQGYRRRRDGWLLVLTWGLGLGRHDALRVRGSDAQEIVVAAGWPLGGQQLSADPSTCWSCTAVRWWQLRIAEYEWSRLAVRTTLREQQADVAAQHVCGSQDWPRILRRLPVWVTLAPAIDQHGWISSGHESTSLGSDQLRERSMTPRALTTVLASYRQPTQKAATERSGSAGNVEAAVGTTPPPAGDDESCARLLDRLDDAVRAADVVNSRLAALLADS